MSRLEAARRLAGSLAVRGFFHGFSTAAQLHPAAYPRFQGVERLRNIRYQDGKRREHLLDVYRPLTSKVRKGPPWPLVFYIHGGGFQILSKDTHWLMGLAFARRGFTTFNVSYRLAPKHPYPAAVEDVCDAFVWAIANATRYGADPTRVVIAGESAGANLAASLAIALAYERPEPWAKRAFATGVAPRAVVPACGVFQVTDMARLVRRKQHIPAYIADRLEEVESGYLRGMPAGCSTDLADPLLVFERGETPVRPLPPFFLPVGTKDPLLPDTRRMAVALRKLGAVAEDAYYPGELHAFHAFVMRKNARKCWRDTFAFLDEHVREG